MNGASVDVAARVRGLWGLKALGVVVPVLPRRVLLPLARAAARRARVDVFVAGRKVRTIRPVVDVVAG